MPILPRPRSLLCGLFLAAALALAPAGGASACPVPESAPPEAPWGCKPRPGLELTWEVRGAQAPGAVVDTEIRLSPRFAVEEVVLSVSLPPDLEVLGPVPAYRGRPAPGEVLTFPLTFRVPTRPTRLLEARAEVTTVSGSYRVGAVLDPVGPRGIRSKAEAGSFTSTPDGEFYRYPAVRLEPGSYDPVAPESAGRGARRAGDDLPAATDDPAALPGTVDVEGRFLYRDRSIDPDGFVNADPANDPLKPIRWANIELLEVVGQTETVVGSGFTDELGGFAFTVDEAGEATYKLRLVSTAANWGGTPLKVRFSTAQPVYYSLVTDSFEKPSAGTPVGDFAAEPGQGGEAFNVFDAALDGALTVESLAGSLPSASLNIYWNANSTSGTNFSRPAAINLLSDEGYDDSVIIHEYGHYVAYHYSKDDSYGGPHYVEDSNQDVRLSWSEGWASYFQSATRARTGDPHPSWYVDTYGTPGAGQLWFSYDCEGPTYPVKGAGSEVAVQALLWDIEDGASTPDPWPGVDDDPLELDRSGIWEVLTGPIMNATYVSLEDFWEGWFDPSVDNGYAAAMRTTFTALGAEYYADGHEGDDSAALATTLPLEGSPRHHSFYPAGDEDHHRFDLAAGDIVTAETLNLIGFGDTRIEARDPDGLLVAENGDRSANDLSSLVTFTAEKTGTYTLRVTREFGTESRYASYGSYDIRAMRGGASAVSLLESAVQAGVTNVGFGVGAAWADYDGDGDLDLYAVNNTAAGTASTARDALLRNRGDGRFDDVTSAAGLGVREGGVGAAWGDYDHDGRPDLFVTDHGLFHNLGGGSFADVTVTSGVADIGREFDAAWVDADNDGRLDLFVARLDGPSALWHNNGDGTFTDVAPEAGFDFPAGGGAHGCAWGDYDGDRFPDLFLAGTDPPYHVLYRNLGQNRFEDVTAAAGVAASVPANGGVWAHVDDDERLDLFVASEGANSLYLGRVSGVFEEAGARYGVNDPGVATGAGFADYDLDGDLDLFVASVAGTDLLYQNLGGAMLRVTQAADPGQAYGCAWGDSDGDGTPDLYVTRGCTTYACQYNLLYRPQNVAGSWLKVKLEGDVANRDGIGAMVRLHAGGEVQVRCMGTRVGWAAKSLEPVHFGFPAGTVVDSVEVLWPSYGYNVVRSPSPETTLLIHEDSTTPVRPPAVTPPVLTLSAASPNPFQRATSLAFELGRRARVRAEVFDARGRLVRTLIDRDMAAGRHVAGWDGDDQKGRAAHSGVYFYRLRADGWSEVRKLVLISR